MSTTNDAIRILFVDDEPDLAEVAVKCLEGEDERFDVETATDAREADTRLAEEPFDCIVSDYEMPGPNGVEFLEAVRERDPDLPFILYTGKGSEEVAAEAISAGVTDYLQKEVGTGQYTVLANRIGNVVAARRSEQQLERHSDYTDDLLDAIHEIFYVLGPDGDFQRWNESLSEVTGYSDAEIADMHGTDFFADRDVEAIAEAIAEVFQTGHAQIQRPLSTKDGDELPYEFNAVRVSDPEGAPKLVGVGRDISRRTQQQRALAEERDRLDALFEHLSNPVAYGILEGDDAIVRDVNPAFEETFGYSADAAAGERLHDLLLPDDASPEEVEALIGEIQETGELHTEVRRKAVDGTRDFRLDATIRRIGPETLEGYAIYTDISEQKERERALTRQNQRLDDFASVLSHDLRNPLHAAVTYLELARQDCDSESLDGVARSHERMEGLLDGVLALARGGRTVTSTEPVDLADLFEAIAYDMETSDATFATETERVIRADERRLHRLLENLVRNAVEHGGKGVSVTLGECSGGFYLEDDGPGIPEEDRERIFETGVSTTDEGTGFGLSIAREIAEVHDWRLRVTESAEGGARFEITGVDIE